MDEQLEKIYILLPDGKAEGLWAKPLGDNLYELRNTPFEAFDLHFMDVVQALPDSLDKKPRIREIVRRSGHKTLRVIFQNTDESQKQRILCELNDMHAYYENANSKLYAIDVEPQGDYLAVCNYLWELEQQGVLEYETGTTGGAE